jgi:DNA (cytosine-5)-methyltransferase 1
MEDQALDRAPIWDDLKSFDGRPWRGRVDVISAGYPCQPFSLAGKRGGTDDERHLWPHVARVIREIDPAIVFLENVPGHLSLGFEEVLSDLESMDRRVATGLFTASEVGNSHRRARLYAVAHAARVSQREPQYAIGAVARQDTRQDFVWRGDQGDVGYAERAGLEERSRERGHDGAQRQAVERTGLPQFAPGPTDEAGWRDVIRRWPELAPALPAIRGMADGPASRMDRLWMLGNGVVPLAAANAFLTLDAALRGVKA